jgi:hypothetical protein
LFNGSWFGDDRQLCLLSPKKLRVCGHPFGFRGNFAGNVSNGNVLVEINPNDDLASTTWPAAATLKQHLIAGGIIRYDGFPLKTNPDVPLGEIRILIGVYPQPLDPPVQPMSGP